MQVILVALLLIAITSSHVMADQPTPIEIASPDGPIIANKTTVEAVPQEITALRGDRLSAVVSLSNYGSRFVATYLADTSDPGLKDYDRAFRAWQTSDQPVHTDQQVVEILGAYLGNRCVADFNMEWVLVKDEYGTNYAVRGKTVEVMAFPFSTVLKRIESEQYDFMFGVYHAVRQAAKSGGYRARGSEKEE